MNINTRDLFRKIRKAGLAIMVLLISLFSRAQIHNLNLPAAPPPTPPEYNFTFNQVIPANTAAVHAQTAIATVIWDFGAPPAGAVINGRQLQHMGITIELPADPGTNVSSAQNVTITGTPNAAGSFSFSVIVADAANPATSATGVFTVIIQQRMDVVLVLDRSGSMGATLGTGTRWTALRQATMNFMNLYQSLRPQDRTSISYFDTDLNPLSTCCGVLTPNTPNTPDLATKIGNELLEPANQPQGMTAMGLGLQNAQTKLSDATRARNVLLITDGEQNQIPTVNTNGQGYSDGTSIPGGPAPGGVRVTTIGIGSPSGAFHTTLQNLAINNRGSYNITNDGTAFTFQTGDINGDLSSGFTNNFITMLSNNSPQLIDRTSHAIPANNNAVTLQQFPLNKEVDKLVLEFVVGRNFERPQLLQLLQRIQVTRNDTSVLSYAELKFAGNYTNTLLLIFDFKNPPYERQPWNPEGKWKITISDSTLKFGFCKLTSIADDHRLHMKRTWGNTNPKVKDDFPITFNMDWLGFPVKEAKIEVLVMVPNTDLGQLLSEAGNVKLSDSADAGAPGVQKFNQLWATDSAFRKALEASGKLVTLSSTGPMKYEGSFKDLPVAGLYRLLYRITGKDSASGEFQRFISESFYTTFSNVDLTKSNVTTTIDGTVLIMNLKPITTYGVLIGPAMGDAFTVSNPGIKITKVVDHQDGSYTLTFEGKINEPTKIEILGQTVHDGKLEDAGKGGGSPILGLPAWLFWLLAILLLALVLWLIFRKK